MTKTFLILITAVLSLGQAQATEYFETLKQLYNEAPTPALWREDFTEDAYTACAISNSDNPNRSTYALLGTCLYSTPPAGPLFPINSYEVPCLYTAKDAFRIQNKDLHYGFVKDNAAFADGASVSTVGSELVVNTLAGKSVLSMKKHQNYLVFKFMPEYVENYGYCWK